ncbi:MAG: sugar kinase [Candidatus Izemoplasmatales bacterium]|nr:sugar kinase [bacterium]MDZ4197381.1 sugar kinase [Candidatus Izemoplasmatales bacterium]
MAKIVTLGEIMLRLSTPLQSRFVQSDVLDVVYGGGEANVCVSLANYGHEAYFVSKVPTHEIGQAAINALTRFQVHCDYVLRGGDRLGIYFLETGASMRPSKVIYDRANSAISKAQASEFNFDEIFKDADWFHWSGITPALGPNAAELTKQACIAAKRHGVRISVDLNYRKKLWTPKQAQAVMRPLMQYVDVCIGNEEDAQLVLGLEPKGIDVTSASYHTKTYQVMMQQMIDEFGFKTVASTLRESFSATKNGWSAVMLHQGVFYESNHYIIEPIIDRVGGGDSFSGGLIHGMLTKDPQNGLNFAVCASALKHTIAGDFNLVSISEVEALMHGDASGRVQR